MMVFFSWKGYNELEEYVMIAMNIKNIRVRCIRVNESKNLNY